MKNIHDAGAIFVLVSIVVLVSIPTAKSGQPARGLRDCVTGLGAEQQQECDREISKQVGGGSNITPLNGGWQLVKTRNLSGGPDAVSVMHVADTKKSDVGLAGLSLQCGRKGIEVVLITLERMSRSDRPKVALSSGTGPMVQLEASVVQAGDALLLPENASELATGDWQRATELSVEIGSKPTPIRGMVPIGGLAAAYRMLTQSCPAR